MNTQDTANVAKIQQPNGTTLNIQTLQQYSFFYYDELIEEVFFTCTRFTVFREFVQNCGMYFDNCEWARIHLRQIRSDSFNYR